MTDTEHTPNLVDDVDEELFEDFDAYWAQRERARRAPVVAIRGIDIEAPTDLPVELELRPDKWAGAQTFDELREFLELLLGDAVDDLVATGVGVRELQLLITWACANGSGKRTTLAEADELLVKAEQQDGQGNRATRRAAARTRSGGRSARTGR